MHDCMQALGPDAAKGALNHHRKHWESIVSIVAEQWGGRQRAGRLLSQHGDAVSAVREALKLF